MANKFTRWLDRKKIQMEMQREIDISLHPWKAKDPIIEGKKAGYARAAEEFKPILANLRRQCTRLMKEHDNNKLEFDKYSENLLKKLKRLEEEKKRLVKIRNEKSRDMDEKYGTDTAQTAGMLVFDFSILFRKYKFKKSELEGYEEARGIFEEKIKKEKEKIAVLKKRCDKDTRKAMTLITDILNEIAMIKLEIAQIELIMDV